MTTQVIRIFVLAIVLFYQLPVFGKTAAPELLIQIEKAVVKKSSSICVPVKVSGFKNLVAVQFTIRFDGLILRLDSVRSSKKLPIQPKFGYESIGSNKKDQMTLSWNAADFSLNYSLPDNSTFFELCFSTLAVGTGKIWLDSLGTVELIDDKVNLLNVRSVTGEVKVIPTGKVLEPAVNFIPVKKPTAQTFDIKIYPNPGRDRLNIALPEELTPVGTLCLKDLQGKIMLRQVISARLEQLEVADLPQGIYFLEIRGQEKIFGARVVLLGKD
jgi:hypothetical protein